MCGVCLPLAAGSSFLCDDGVDVCGGTRIERVEWMVVHPHGCMCGGWLRQPGQGVAVAGEQRWWHGVIAHFHQCLDTLCECVAACLTTAELLHQSIVLTSVKTSAAVSSCSAVRVWFDAAREEDSPART